MSIKITIPNSSSDVLTFGSGNTPTAAQIAGIDSGSSNGQLALYTTASGTSTERVRINASGNVGIGTTSPGYRLDVRGGNARIAANASGASDGVLYFGNAATNYIFGGDGNNYMTFGVNNAERMRIDSSGNLLVGTTTVGGNNAGFRAYSYGAINSTTVTADYSIFNKTTTTTGKQIEFRSADTNVGNITSTSTATQFNTSSSDYRLKDEVSEFTGGLERIKALRPVSFRWKAQDVHDIGFIAHEMQAIVPECVTGEKDAVDSSGNPEYQSIFPAPAQMIATLVSAIQEQQAIITSLTDRITLLESK